MEEQHQKVRESWTTVKLELLTERTKRAALSKDRNILLNMRTLKEFILYTKSRLERNNPHLPSPTVGTKTWITVMSRCESWTTKRADHRRADAFKILVLEKILETLDHGRSNQSIQKELTLNTHWKN